MSDSYPKPRDLRRPLDPPADYKRLQREAPVCPVKIWDGSTPWLITRHADACEALADPRLCGDFTHPGFPHTSPASKARRARLLPFAFRPEAEYRPQRAMLLHEFTSRKMEAWRPAIQRTVDEAINAMLAGPRPIDLMAAFALPVAIRVICDVLGMPREDAEHLHVLSRTVGSRTAPKEAVERALDALDGFFHRLVATNVRAPGDTLVGRVVAEQVLPGKLSEPDAAAMFQLLFHAGHGPSAYMFGMGVVALLLHPDQLDRFRAMEDPREISAAIQELLRFVTVSHSARQRVALEDVTLGGQHIRAGEGVLVQLSAANRDETVFPEPDRLDLQREPRPNLAMGHGMHLCTGRALALIQLEVVFRTLFRRIPTLRLAVPVEDIPFKQDENILGAHELPVTW
ncbi:cytochrome P450 [Pyxidicoccus fallax]|uniref:Cytochrome P450 n=1 Tax=Pyxidicoccus fallax TaxID=394095 RepID=A0A848LG25_9BACT|nr:cytochrome P450 [Pyxidicoccus fallax]NMO16213.1 cytochrome P450 [Pyxidicoccus fallax]NPC77704.1 cytochrome P450 [Pyxidicoccus fallax]